MVTANKKASTLEDGYSTKNGGMCTIKHEIRSSKFSEILIKTELKAETALDLNNFYNLINICLNAVTRLIEYFLPSYQSIKIHSNLE